MTLLKYCCETVNVWLHLRLAGTYSIIFCQMRRHCAIYSSKTVTYIFIALYRQSKHNTTYYVVDRCPMNQHDLHVHNLTRQSCEAGQDSCDLPINDTLAGVNSQSVLINTSHMAKKVQETFDDDPELAGVIIIDEGDAQLLGMISRRRFMEMYSKPFRKELHNKKPLKLLVKYEFDSPLCLQESDNIDQAVRVALSRPHDQRYEPIVVQTVNGGLKLINMQVLLLELAKVYERQTIELQGTISRVKQLEGIIAICCYCKKIRNDTNSWDQLETYISSHSEALFSHGICPECYQQQIEELKKCKSV